MIIHKVNFSKVSVDDVLKEINKLGNRKAIQNTGIPVKILKQNADIFGSYICHFFNVCVDEGTFPSVLKHASITPVFKKGYRGSTLLCLIVGEFKLQIFGKKTPQVNLIIIRE